MTENQTWFHSEDVLSNQPPIIVDDLQGYVLPHAGTEYTGDIIRHTLQFRPSNIESIRRVYIYYYPANEEPDVDIGVDPNTSTDDRIILSNISREKCHHELYVPFRSILHYFRYWRMNIDQIKFIPINARNIHIRGGSGQKNTHRLKYIRKRQQQTYRLRNYKIGGNGSKDTNFYIISADFSHHKPLQYALLNENKAAHAIVTYSLSFSQSHSYLNEIDDVRTFRLFIRNHSNLSFQWIGRTRSEGERAVGYLTFLIRPIFQPSVKYTKTASERKIDGIFVTCYDAEMNARECLGDWYLENGDRWNQTKEDLFINEVVDKARTTSRLTGGRNTEIPITRCVITYLFKDTFASNTNAFIRGWHSIQTNAIYLPDVLLEHAKEDGVWITPRDTEWNISTTNKNKNVAFDLTETLAELDEKAGFLSSKQTNNITLYTVRTRVKKTR
jgi:hypothetical protein